MSFLQRESKAGRLTNEQRVRKLLQAAELLDNSQTLSFALSSVSFIYDESGDDKALTELESDCPVSAKHYYGDLF